MSTISIKVESMCISVQMMWLQLAIFATAVVGYILYTVVFWFWFIYLIDVIKRKRGYYKATLRCLEREFDPHQQTLAYNAKTELVKFVFLFCLNLIEWIGFTAAIMTCIMNVVWDYQLEFLTNHLLSVLGKWYHRLNLPLLLDQCLVNFMAILGSLCMYLSARYAQKSWIKSNRIQYWICFFLLSSIISQILIIISYTRFIGVWCDEIINVVCMIFAWKQYRKLDMVLQWFIVDLRVSGVMELLEKHIKMKRRFNRIFTTIWIAITCALVASLIDLFSHTTQYILSMNTHSFLNKLLNSTLFKTIYTKISFSLTECITIVGFLFFFIPYIGYGLCTMSVLLWRLFRGKTGYRTHFPVQLTKSLI